MFAFEITVKALTSSRHQVFCSEHGQIGGLYATDALAREAMHAHSTDAHTPVRIELRETVEVTRQNGTVQRGVVTSRDFLSDGYTIEGYQVFIPETGTSMIIAADRVRPLRDTRPAGTRRQPSAPVVEGWPSLTEDQAPDFVGELPNGTARTVEIRWTVPGVVNEHEFTHRLIVADEADARAQIRRDFLMPGVDPSTVRLISVRRIYPTGY